MAISILGAGNVGMALARAFVARGESVTFGRPDRRSTTTRSPASARWRASHRPGRRSPPATW